MNIKRDYYDAQFPDNSLIFNDLNFQDLNKKQPNMTNVELAKEVYALFSTGNVPAVLALFDPAIHWDECKSFPYAKGDNIFIGPDEVLKKIFMSIPEYYEGFTITVTDIFGSGDKVAMQGYYEGVYKPTGKRFKANAAHIWTVKDGKFTHFFQAVDTATIIN